MSDEFDDVIDDEDDEIIWNCGCGLLVVDVMHCPSCGACHPSGCGFDHDDEEECDGEAEPWEQGIFEREMEDVLGPPHNEVED